MQASPQPLKNERAVALEALSGVTSGGYNNIVLNKVLLSHPHLSRGQRAFVTECTNGALRRLLTLDYIINQVSSTNTRSMERAVLNILRLAVYQLAFMRDEAPHAVVSEAVALAEAESKENTAIKGFVNAVLRNIQRTLPQIFESIEKIKNDSRDAYLEVKYSCRRNVIEILERELGAGETEVFLAHINKHRPSTTICAKDDPQALLEELKKRGTVTPGRFFPRAMNITKMPEMTTLTAFKRGMFHVMDEGAMLAVAAAGLKPGMKVLDLCAAPGGKAFLAAYEMNDEGHIDARDIYLHKVDLIRDGARRLKLSSARAS